MKTLRVVLISAIFVCLGNGVPMPATYDTIVIGLGAAGSAAASTLAAAGKKVLALEAQNKIGGRVNTQPFGDGVVELGAEWIHGTESSSTYELAIKNNVSILPQDLSFKVYNSDGTSEREALINELTEFALSVVDDPPEKPEPLGQYITKRVIDYIKTNHSSVQNDTEFINGFLEFMDLLINNYESSNSWNDVTTQSKYEHLGGHQHMSWHKNGYKTLFEILLNTYNNGPGYPSLEIKLNTEVTNIQYPQNPNEPVVVTTKDGATYTAKTAIVTLSVGVLKERHTNIFSPQLPAEKIKAFDVIPMGLLNKVDLLFHEPWWSFPGQNYNFFWNKAMKESISAEDQWMTKITFISNPMGSKNVMTLWFSGDRARLVSNLGTNGHTTLFSPRLPREKIELINAIAIGVVNKIVMLYDDVFWPRDGVFFAFIWRESAKRQVSNEDWWTTKIFGASCPMGNRNVLTAWTCGEGAKLIENLPDDVVKRKTMEVIRRFMGTGKTIPEPVEMLKSSWYSNPFTRGSYSYDNVQTPLNPTARVDLALPITDSAGSPRLLFAGEATEKVHFSTVHGAVDSGRREARRLLESSKL